jgi:histidinol dehydrogenase
MPAGPSEVMVVVDASSDPSFAAADMLSQAEHGSDSQAILVVQASDELAGHQIADAVETQHGMQLASLPRKEIAQAALSHSKIIIVTDEESVIRVVNTYAPEHLLLQTIDFSAVAAQVVNAGSVFLGSCSCESREITPRGRTTHSRPTGGQDPTEASRSTVIRRRSRSSGSPARFAFTRSGHRDDGFGRIA